MRSSWRIPRQITTRWGPLVRRWVCAAGQPASPRVDRCNWLSGSDRVSPAFTGRSGTQRARTSPHPISSRTPVPRSTAAAFQAVSWAKVPGRRVSSSHRVIRGFRPSRKAGRQTGGVRFIPRSAGLERLAEIPAMAFWSVDLVAARAIRPRLDLGNGRAGRPRSVPVAGQVRDGDAHQLSHLAELGRPPEAGPGRAEHDDAAVTGEQLGVPDGPVVSRIAGSLGETEDLDQPVHGGTGIRVEKIRNDLRIWILLRHGSDFTPGAGRSPGIRGSAC